MTIQEIKDFISNYFSPYRKDKLKEELNNLELRQIYIVKERINEIENSSENEEDFHLTKIIDNPHNFSILTDKEGFEGVTIDESVYRNN